MRADELRNAVGRIVEILNGADIRGAVDRFRVARGDERTVAAARLGHAGAMVMQRFEDLGQAERLVVRFMHLQELASPAYWSRLLEGSTDPKAVTGELVRLTSRVVFATGQLPGLLGLLDAVEASGPMRHAPAAGEAALVVRLIDAGERASDPDRIARSIDGIDMLYSACASIARKPAMDLRLEGVDGEATRDIHLTGERDAVAAVAAVLDSIPEAVSELDEDADIDLDDLVRSLPVFEDLATLGSSGAFPEADLRDIAETMHQGALLVLESGVARVQPALPAASPGAVIRPTAAPADAARPTPAADVPTAPPVLSRRAKPVAGPVVTPRGGGSGNGAVAHPADDPHYAEYLRQREAWRRPADAGAAPRAAEASADEAEASRRRDAVEDMLQSLGKARGDG